MKSSGFIYLITYKLKAFLLIKITSWELNMWL